jgi:hypothetical protein
MDSMGPSHNGGTTRDTSDASDGYPTNPPSRNGAALHELLHASLPTVKEEELSGSHGGTSSLRASQSQLQMGGSSSTLAQCAMVPAAILQHQAQTVAESQQESDEDRVQLQAPVASKFSASAFGASYMSTSPSQSIAYAHASNSQQESDRQVSIGPMHNIAGPPTGIFLPTGISSMGPVSSMLSGPMSQTTAGPLSASTTLGVFPVRPAEDHKLMKTSTSC